MNRARARLLVALAAASACVLVTGITTAVATTVTPTTSTAATAPSPWYQSGWNQGETGFNPLESTLGAAAVTGLHTAWSASTPEPCCDAAQTTGVVSSGGTAYFMGAAADVHAVTARTGVPRWTRQAPECGIASAGPALTMGLLLVPTQECTPDDANSWLTAYDASTGAVRWSLLQGNRMSSPVTFKGIAVVQADPPGEIQPNRLVAVNVHTGAVLWHRSLPGQVGALASDSTRLFVSTGSALTAVNPSTGATEWSRSAPGTHVLVSNGKVVTAGVHDGSRVVTSFSPTGGRRWSATSPGAAAFSLAAPTSELLVADANGSVQARNLATGSPTWSTTLPGGVLTQPAVADGVVYATVARPHTSALYALRDGSGAVLWHFTEPGSTDGSGVTAAPSVAAGTLFASLGSGTVRAFRP
jgi:outer membrane protein assembly factor BamB